MSLQEARMSSMRDKIEAQAKVVNKPLKIKVGGKK